MPYCFSAVRITWLAGEKPEISKLACNRMRMPMGGAFESVTLDAQCDAGGVNASCVVGRVKRTA